MFIRFAGVIGILACSSCCALAQEAQFKIPEICTSYQSDKRLDPIRGKFALGEGAMRFAVITDEMKRNESKPTQVERKALQIYHLGQTACLKALTDTKQQYHVDAADPISAKPYVESQLALRLLIDAKISYADYYRRIEKASNLMIEQTLQASGKKEIEAWLTESSKSWPSNSPLWDFYNYSMQIAKDLGDGKISRQTANELIEAKRVSVNQEIAASLMPKTATLNCSFEMSGITQEIPLRIDYTKKSVDGNKAIFTETEIMWKSSSKDGTVFANILNRISGNLITSGYEALLQAHCLPAVKQF